ncbi:MAG: hypothetical protein KDD60_12035, partial [Bdellovibrionales bacterium]|nr:hypothetical protein [Bdellovibrionales bacterium]
MNKDRCCFGLLRYFILSVVCLANAEFALCQSDDTVDTKKFLLRMASEREMVVSYQYRCKLKTSEGFSVFPNNLSLICEYSKLDDHFLLVYDFSECDERERKTTKWIGRSGKYLISGEAGKQSYLGAWNNDTNILRTQPHFDVLGLGLGFCGDFGMGSDFGTLVSGLNKLADADVLQVVKQEDGIRRISFKGGGKPLISVDVEQGYWPVKSELAHANWNLKVKKVGEIFLPVVFDLECFQQDKTTGKVSGTIEWISVNEPFPTGRESASRIADEMLSNYGAAADER